jgi:undecaprenyl-diphosphatase
LAKADETVFLWLNGLVGELPFFDRIVELVVSDYLVPVSLALALVGMWFAGGDKLTRQKHQIGVFVALSAMAISSLAVFTINAAYFRPRPFVDHEVTRLFYAPTDSSFPSNPAAAAFAIAVAVWAVNRRLGSLLLTAASLYGFARVYAGVHYPLDIVSGALIAIVVTFLTFKIRDLLGPILTWVIKVGRIFCLA